MASNSQIQSRSIFGRDRWRVTIGEDRECQNALVDSDEMQSASQPLDHTMIPVAHLMPWHPSLIKEAYWKKGRNHLKDKLCKVSKKKATNVIPWLSPNVQQQLLHHKQTNKGSVSTTIIAKKMSKGGEIVTTTKLFSKTHIKATWICIKPIYFFFFVNVPTVAYKSSLFDSSNSFPLEVLIVDIREQ
ncbi:hypothetical protein Cgig2_031637 [Carnegiea gigantea]|uniref:Uncharacterized protein n=1 Tax=Carnegiea gigantea TaxID=171969 RepID=A0A9Q1QE08_9CARY|nr:hypothetical protein Cgig2_031637 [Carnegiea gigantea]